MDKLLQACMAINAMGAESPVLCLDNETFLKYKEMIPKDRLQSIKVELGEGFVFADVCFCNTNK